MLLVIPSINIHEGHCSFPIIGEVGTEDLYMGYAQNPDDMCRLLRRENSKSIHITDVDSLNNSPYDNIDSVIYLADTVDIPMQYLSNLKTENQCRYLLDSGIYRIILQDMPITHPEIVTGLIHEYTGSRISVYINDLSGKVNFKELKRVFKTEDYLNHLRDIGCSRILYHNESFEDREEVQFDDLLGLAKKTSMKFTVFEGIYSPVKLWELNSYKNFGIDSVVIGKPLYENRFPCQKIWREIECKLEI